MTEHDLLKAILTDLTLYQNNESQCLTNSFINVLQHDHHHVKHIPLPWPLFPETHYETWLVVLLMHAPQLWFFHVDRLCLKAVSWTVSKRCFEQFALRYHQRKQNHTRLSQGALAALCSIIKPHLPCVRRVPSVIASFLLQLCVNEQVHHILLPP